MHQIKIIYRSNDIAGLEITEEFLLSERLKFTQGTKILEDIKEIEKRYGEAESWLRFAHDYTYENNRTVINLDGDNYEMCISRNLLPIIKLSY